METYRWSSIAVFNCCVPVLPAIVQELKPHLPVLVHMLHTVSFPLRCTIPVGFLQATWLATNLFTFCAYVFQCSRSLSPSLPLYVSRALHAPSLPPSLPPSLYLGCVRARVYSIILVACRALMKRWPLQQGVEVFITRTTSCWQPAVLLAQLS